MNPNSNTTTDKLGINHLFTLTQRLLTKISSGKTNDTIMICPNSMPRLKNKRDAARWLPPKFSSDIIPANPKP